MRTPQQQHGLQGFSSTRNGVCKGAPRAAHQSQQPGLSNSTVASYSKIASYIFPDSVRPCQEITLEDLEPEDVALLRKGYFQTLSQRVIERDVA
jgi:hypothetical protein